MQHRGDRDKPDDIIRENHRAPAAIHGITKAVRNSCESLGSGIAQVLSLTAVDEVMRLTFSAQFMNKPFMNDFYFEFYLRKGYRVDPKTYEYIEDVQNDMFRVGYLPKKIDISRALSHLEKEFGMQLLKDFFHYLQRGIDSVSSEQLLMYTDPRDERIKNNHSVELTSEDRKIIQLTRQIDVEHLHCVTNVILGDSVVGMNCTNDLLKPNTAQCAVSGMNILQGHKIIRTVMQKAIRAENVFVYLGTNDLLNCVKGKSIHAYTKEEMEYARRKLIDNYLWLANRAWWANICRRTVKVTFILPFFRYTLKEMNWKARKTAENMNAILKNLKKDILAARTDDFVEFIQLDHIFGAQADGLHIRPTELVMALLCVDDARAGTRPSEEMGYRGTLPGDVMDFPLLIAKIYEMGIDYQRVLCRRIQQKEASIMELRTTDWYVVTKLIAKVKPDFAAMTPIANIKLMHNSIVIQEMFDKIDADVAKIRDEEKVRPEFTIKQSRREGLADTLLTIITDMYESDETVMNFTLMQTLKDLKESKNRLTPDYARSILDMIMDDPAWKGAEELMLKNLAYKKDKSNNAVLAHLRLWDIISLIMVFGPKNFNEGPKQWDWFGLDEPSMNLAVVLLSREGIRKLTSASRYLGSAKDSVSIYTQLAVQKRRDVIMWRINTTRTYMRLSKGSSPTCTVILML